MDRIFMASFLLLSLIFYAGCNDSKPVKTEPVKESKIKEADHPALLKVQKDKSIYQVYRVIKHFGKLKETHVPLKNISLGSGNALNPEVFYDVYELDIDEKGYWFRILFKTANRAIRKSSKVKRMMSGLPRYVMDIRLKTPAKKLYILSDAEADGVLDYAAPLNKNRKKLTLNINLLKNMQKKYRMILRIVKKYYKQIK